MIPHPPPAGEADPTLACPRCAKMVEGERFLVFSSSLRRYHDLCGPCVEALAPPEGYASPPREG